MTWQAYTRTVAIHNARAVLLLNAACKLIDSALHHHDLPTWSATVDGSVG